MPYCEAMADTMRADLGVEPGLSERKMFGGICFLLHGNMVCGVGGQGSMYRPGKPAHAQALTLDHVTPMIHGGRSMGGFVRLSEEGFDEAPLRQTLTQMSLAYAASLPSKG